MYGWLLGWPKPEDSTPKMKNRKRIPTGLVPLTGNPVGGVVRWYSPISCSQHRRHSFEMIP